MRTDSGHRAALAVVGVPVAAVLAVLVAAGGTPVVEPACARAAGAASATLGPGGGRLVGASDYGGPSDGGDHQSGSFTGDLFGHMAFAELSTNPGDPVAANWDFAALGHLPAHTRLRVTYAGRSVIAEKLDQGRGGVPVQLNGHDYPRALDLWYQTAAALRFSGLGVVRAEAVDGTGPLAATGDATARTAMLDSATAATEAPSIHSGAGLTGPPASRPLRHPHVVLETGPTAASHFTVAATGQIEQDRPLSLRAPSAGELSATALVVAHLDPNAGSGPATLATAQRESSLRLTHWLQARYAIPARDVLGAGETAGSPYRHGRAPTRRSAATRPGGASAWRGPAMDGYRQALAESGSSATAGCGAHASAATGDAPLTPGERARVLPDGRAAAPASAPAPVQAMIAAGNRIIGKPYSQASPHGTPYTQILDHYDCSSSVSYLLFWAGIIRDANENFDSTALESFGLPGPGRWVTWHANADHVYMEVAGIRWDTHGEGPNPGIGWHPGQRQGSGFVPRHPSGL